MSSLVELPITDKEHAAAASNGVGPHRFAGCGMLVAGGFCYRMLVGDGESFVSRRIHQLLRVPPTGSSASGDFRSPRHSLPLVFPVETVFLENRPSIGRNYCGCWGWGTAADEIWDVTPGRRGERSPLGRPAPPGGRRIPPFGRGRMVEARVTRGPLPRAWTLATVAAMGLASVGCTMCPDPFDYSGPVPNGSSPQNDFRARSNGILPLGAAPRPWGGSANGSRT